MLCPNCQKTEDDHASKCSHCGFELAQWRIRAQMSGAASEPPGLKKGKPVWRVLVWSAVLAAAGGVWFMDRLGFDESSGAPSFIFGGKASAMPAAGDVWRFQGQVFDLARGSPVKGAKVMFFDFEKGQTYEAMTDEIGSYAVDVAVRWRMGYTAAVEHPLYLKRLWPGAVVSRERKERLQLGLETGSERPAGSIYRGVRLGKPSTFDFAIFPQELGDAEKAEAGR